MIFSPFFRVGGWGLEHSLKAAPHVVGSFFVVSLSSIFFPLVESFNRLVSRSPGMFKQVRVDVSLALLRGSLRFLRYFLLFSSLRFELHLIVVRYFEFVDPIYALEVERLFQRGHDLFSDCDRDSVAGLGGMLLLFTGALA